MNSRAADQVDLCDSGYPVCRFFCCAYFLPVLELICNYNGALTGEISDNIIGYLGNLTHS
jgi:hypothetical protein